MFIIWLRKDGYVGASSAKDVAEMAARMEKSSNPKFQLDRVLFTAEEWDTAAVETFKLSRRVHPHHLYQAER